MKLLITISLIALCGCVAVPKTEINLHKGTFSSPKDDSFSNVQVDYDTNGVTHLSIGAANGANNPAVIAATAAGQNLLTQTYGQIFLSGAQMGGNIAGSFFGLPGAGSLLFQPGNVNGGIGSFSIITNFLNTPKPVILTNIIWITNSVPTTNAPAK
jgi:hypothetical protein